MGILDFDKENEDICLEWYIVWQQLHRHISANPELKLLIQCNLNPTEIITVSSSTEMPEPY